MIRPWGLDAWYEQSAVVPYRRRKGNVEVCLITSLSAKRWIVPKGIIEPELTPAASAAKEALEEAGIEGHVWPKKIGEYALSKYGGICRVRTYLMRVEAVHEDWPESDWRERRWMPLDAAVRRVHPQGLAQILGRVPRWIRKLEG